MYWISFTFIIIVVVFCRVLSINHRDWESPVIPPNFDSLVANEKNAKKNRLNIAKKDDGLLITRNLWIAFREVPPFKELSEHLKRLIKRSKSANWSINLIDGDKAEDLFMNTYFPDTSILWAYKSFSPAAHVSRVDIWRYCVLYAFGGVYLDDDAYIHSPFDQIIQANDTLVLSIESNIFPMCYHDRYNLSDNTMTERYNTDKYKQYFNGNNLVNWCMLTAPKHPLILRTLETIVHLVREQYFIRPAIKEGGGGSKKIICTTGPGVLTAVARDMLLEHEISHGGKNETFPLRLVSSDFAEFGGIWKTSYSQTKSYRGRQYRHYTSVFEKEDPPLLHTYHNHSFKIRDDAYDGKWDYNKI